MAKMKTANSPLEVEALVREGGDVEIDVNFPCSKALLFDFIMLAKKCGVDVSMQSSMEDATVPGSASPLYWSCNDDFEAGPLIALAELFGTSPYRIYFYGLR